MKRWWLPLPGMAVQFPFKDDGGGVSRQLCADWPHRWTCPSDRHPEFLVVARDICWLEAVIEAHEFNVHGLAYAAMGVALDPLRAT